MNVTRDVILDLLPLCHAGEASDDTQELVTAFAAQDAQIARLLAAPPATALPEPPLSLNKEKEMQTLEKAKTYMKRQTILLGIASALSLIAVIVLVGLGAFLTLFPMADRDPRAVLMLAASGGLLSVLLALAAWIAYFIFRHHAAQAPRRATS